MADLEQYAFNLPSPKAKQNTLDPIKELPSSEESLKETELPSYRFQSFDTAKTAFLTEHTFDRIERLTYLAKSATKNNKSSTTGYIDDLADLATGLAMELLEAQVDVERIRKQYEADGDKVSEMVTLLRSSRTKLEAERARVQDLGTRMAGIKFDHMTALAKCQVEKATYELRARDALSLEGAYKSALKELNDTKDENEKELLMMAAQMWSLKMMVCEMFQKSQKALGKGMTATNEEIDFAIARLDQVMNDSMNRGEWGKKYQESSFPKSVSGDVALNNFSPSMLLSSTTRHRADSGVEGCTSMDETSINSDEKTDITVLKHLDSIATNDPYWHEEEHRLWADCGSVSDASYESWKPYYD